MNDLLLQTAVTDAFGLTERNHRTIQAVFSQFPAVKEVALFGSRAAGTHKPYSDIDMVMLNSGVDSLQYARLISAFEESDLPFFVDLLLWDRIRNEDLKQEISNTSKPLYMAG